MGYGDTEVGSLSVTGKRDIFEGAFVLAFELARA